MPQLSRRDDALITTFGRLVEAQSRLERRLGADLEARCDLPHAWFEVLVRLGRSAAGRLTMGSLAEEVSLTTGGVTRLVDRMEAAGYVERVPCPTDRRVSYASLTDSGRAKLDEATQVHAANLRSVFATFSDEDRNTLDALLDRLRPVHADLAAGS
ncbi:DNA-binding transcriptional regulator, MarR family [Geodermatophilus obscurus]|uniref:DNA-binding transcriptional regulator, MarR family n=1 Tax=Geodermatophilus obscurus TaxID=1861 RepID=A0A1M7SNJ9_9ACTN|nr:MarR family transcriptional regulator [Geodermatophilus obscurus]SHN60051.1 DNA-binding transcriptional regulator, MarR family [Geodermatophilus obscurus]